MGAEAPRPRVSVVLPTFNEAGNIGALVDALLEELAAYRHEIVVVDDDSPDGTWRVVEEKARIHPEVRIHRRVGERGLTSAIQAGIRASRGDIVCWMDCDFSMPPATLPLLVKKLGEGFDVAVGSRYAPGGRDARLDTKSRVLASRVITALSSFLLVRSFRDYTSGFIAAKREVFDRIDLRGDYGEYFIDLIFRAHRLGYRIVEVPYACVPRRAGESKTESGFLRKGLKYLFVVARLRFEALRGEPRREAPTQG